MQNIFFVTWKCVNDGDILQLEKARIKNKDGENFLCFFCHKFNLFSSLACGRISSEKNKHTDKQMHAQRTLALPRKYFTGKKHHV